MFPEKVLIVDDDAEVRNLAKLAFVSTGADVVTASNGKEALRQLYQHHPGLVILDIMMPEMDGFETCRNIRLLSDVPILMLTALNQNADIIKGLDAGADDFLTKPFQSDVLLAHARAVLRRTSMASRDISGSIYRDAHLMLDLDAHRVIVQGESVQLTPTEFRLLAYLVKNSGRVRTFEQILENVWGFEYRDSIDYVHVYVSHIRKKIEPDPKDPTYLITDHGVGYHFESKSQ